MEFSVGVCGAQQNNNFPLAFAARRGTKIFRWRLRGAVGQKFSVGVKKFSARACSAQGTKKIRWRLRRPG